jgi:A/G-specific adenine glycosylase
MDRAPARGMFIEPDIFDPNDLPTVMRKAHALTLGK